VSTACSSTTLISGSRSSGTDMSDCHGLDSGAA
jgi:hypothetical protein